MSKNSGKIGNCRDRNECENHSHKCSEFATCENSGRVETIFGFLNHFFTLLKEGSWTCHCKNGFSGNGHVCEDIDECIKETSTST